MANDDSKLVADYKALATNTAHRLLVERMRELQQSAWRAVRQQLSPADQAKLDMLDDLNGTMPGHEPSKEGYLVRMVVAAEERMRTLGESGPKKQGGVY